MHTKSKAVLGLILALAFVITALQYGDLAPGVAAAGTELVSALIEEALPVTDPESSLWQKATPLSVPLSGQSVVKPVRTTPFVDNLEVRSLNNGTHIAFRISWADGVKNNRTTTLQQFRDAVAIQIGQKTQTPYLCMGAANARMQIMQWKADWQADIEEGFKDLQDAFPNFWVDYYPFVIGEPPYRVPEDFPETAKLYLVGYQVGNPFSEPLKVTPVEDAVAEGFSTITTQQSQNAIGRGVWQDGAWSVVISRKMDTGDSQDAPIDGENIVAFAIWDGESQDRGARKSTSTWVTLRIQGPLPAYDILPFIGLAIIIISVPLIAIVLARRPRTRARERERRIRGEESKKK